MDGWLKALVAMACAVIIVGGGYFAWRENRDANDTANAEKERVMRSGCAQAKTQKNALPSLHDYCKERGYF